MKNYSYGFSNDLLKRWQAIKPNFHDKISGIIYCFKKAKYFYGITFIQLFSNPTSAIKRCFGTFRKLFQDLLLPVRMVLF